MRWSHRYRADSGNFHHAAKSVTPACGWGAALGRRAAIAGTKTWLKCVSRTAPISSRRKSRTTSCRLMVPPSLLALSVIKDKLARRAHSARVSTSSCPAVAHQSACTKVTGTVSSSAKIANSANRSRSGFASKVTLASMVADTARWRCVGSLTSSCSPAAPVRSSTRSIPSCRSRSSNCRAGTARSACD